MRSWLVGLTICLGLAAALPPAPARAAREVAELTAREAAELTVRLDAVVAAVEAAYGRVTDLRADFTQTAYLKAVDRTSVARGTVELKRPDKLRWEYATPTPQHIVADGRQLWVWTPALNQVNVTSARAALAGPAGSFLAGLARLGEQFAVRFADPEAPRAPDGSWVLELVPREPLPTLARLVLALDPDDWAPRRAVLHDQLGNTVTMRFARVRLNPGLDAARFVFAAPPGAAVVPVR